MQAGRLRDRVTISNFTSTRSPSGQPIQKWVDGKTVWAEVKGISGRELLSAGAEQAQSTIRVYVRYRNDITAASRLNIITGPFKGETLEVAGPPIPDDRMTILEVLCRQGVKT